MQDDSLWYALHTRHQHENKVATMLVSKGVNTLLPLYETARPWKDRRKILLQPLFSCYVFVQGGVERPLPILSTPGVLGFVQFGRGPVPVPESEIEGIRRLVNGEVPVEPHPFVKCGNRVRVTSGPLK